MMISLFVIIPRGIVVKGIPCSWLCTGIRMIVNNQFPSYSIRGRSSVSAMSLGNIELVCQVMDILRCRAFYIDPAVWKPLVFFHKAGFTIKKSSHYCLLSFLSTYRGLAVCPCALLVTYCFYFSRNTVVHNLSLLFTAAKIEKSGNKYVLEADFCQVREIAYLR